MRTGTTPQVMRKKSTTINEVAREVLHITRDEYALCSYIQYRQADRRGRAGWCVDTKDEIAKFIGITRAGLYKMVDRLAKESLLFVEPKSGALQVTEKWIDTESECKQSLQSKNDERKQSLHATVNKVDKKSSESVNLVTPIYEVNNKVKEIEEEINTPQAAFITTHTPTEFENIRIVEGQEFDLEEKTNLEPISPAARELSDMEAHVRGSGFETEMDTVVTVYRPEGKKPRTPKPAGNSTAAVCAEIKTPEVLDFFHAIHAAWGEWTDYKRRERKGTYKSAKSEAATITELANEVNCDPEAARAAIQRSIAKTYTGICPDKNWKSATPPARYSYEDRPQAHTPEQMKEELSRFYNANSALLSEAQKTAGTNYTGERLKSIVIDFCSNRIARAKQGETFGQHHAELGSWMKRQKGFDASKNPAQQQHTAGPQPQAPLRSAALVKYSPTGPVLRAEKAEL